ncbi:MAG: Smr/MutS family protein [Acidihalobacter sp.]|uniref:Smr/MutS family protein n=1 Tax=Acidihalobacter sp. TaxID=1872108 RepID=UPI00307FC0FE
MSDIDEDDRHLFRETVGNVKRLSHDRREHTPPQRPALPRQREMETREVMLSLKHDPQAHTDEQPGDPVFYARSFLPRSVGRRLRRGHYRIDAELDLHGMNIGEARRSLLQFIHEARQHGAGCVRIIHGKGWRSGNAGPVLKPNVNYWLRQIDEILAFSSATPADGGTGAVYVLLKAF